jgi:hypothetical protein
MTFVEHQDLAGEFTAILNEVVRKPGLGRVGGKIGNWVI